MDSREEGAIKDFIRAWNAMNPTEPLTRSRGLTLANALLIPVSTDMLSGVAPKDGEAYNLIIAYSSTVHRLGSSQMVLRMVYPIIDLHVEAEFKLEATEGRKKEDIFDMIRQAPGGLSSGACLAPDPFIFRSGVNVRARPFLSVAGYHFDGHEDAKRAGQLLREYFKSLPNAD